MIEGPAQRVFVITDSDLKANGGSYELQLGPARRVQVATDRAETGGAALPVYIVTA